MPVLAGQTATAAQHNTDALGGTVIARVSRSTASTAASAAQGVLRIDGVALTAGRRYNIRSNALTITSSVANDRAGVRLAMSTSGTATTSSTVYAQANSPQIDSTGAGCDINVDFNYTPSSDETASIILFTTRLSGTGNVQLLVTASVTIDVEVVDCGEDPGDTGTEL